MKYIECAVSAGGGKGNILFTYLLPDSMDEQTNIGSIVLVPFRSKNVRAVVFGFATKPKFKTKEVIKVFDQTIPPYLIETIKWMSAYYGASLASCLKLIVPAGINKKRRLRKSQNIHGKISQIEKLTDEQNKAVKKILENREKPHLIFGVTGSGKTEVYIKVIEKIIEEGKQCLVLVPEVSLTPQTILRFEERFPGLVGLYHSYLKETERFEIWKEVEAGDKSIVVGSRSALLLPFHELGAIIVDEEHETSYKQDQAPRYNSVELAKKISTIQRSLLLLGSATPSVESFYYAKKGVYFLENLDRRYHQEHMPETIIVDMRNEFKLGNRSIFSEMLQTKIKETLEDHKQIVLFINRRGHSTFVSCRVCGHVMRCPNCEIPLVYHHEKSSVGKLFCHHCNHLENIPETCPKCSSVAIKFFGKGTQKVEEEMHRLFPLARVKRMDGDSVKKDHKNIYEDFKNKNFDVLVGTQMISKGWDLPEVDLVGVISADQSLNLPDFRSAERSFSLITQVTGRTGRGSSRGMAILQSYDPDNVVLKHASKHDFMSFYSEEILKRKELSYPPFSKIIRIYGGFTNSEKALAESEVMKKDIIQNFKNSVVLGPSPGYIPKQRNIYNWQVMVKLPEATNLEETVPSMIKYISDKWIIDVNPITVI